MCVSTGRLEKESWAACKFREPSERGHKAQVSAERPRKERADGYMHMCKTGEAGEGGHRVLASKVGRRTWCV